MRPGPPETVKRSCLQAAPGSHTARDRGSGSWWGWKNLSAQHWNGLGAQSVRGQYFQVLVPVRRQHLGMVSEEALEKREGWKVGWWAGVEAFPPERSQVISSGLESQTQAPRLPESSSS